MSIGKRVGVALLVTGLVGAAFVIWRAPQTPKSAVSNPLSVPSEGVVNPQAAEEIALGQEVETEPALAPLKGPEERALQLLADAEGYSLLRCAVPQGIASEDRLVHTALGQMSVSNGILTAIVKPSGASLILSGGEPVLAIEWRPEEGCHVTDVAFVALTGFVSFEDGSPAAGATVGGCTEHMVTGADGRFELDVVIDPAVMPYCQVAAHKEGLASGWQSVLLMAGAPIDVPLVLMPVIPNPAAADELAELVEDLKAAPLVTDTPYSRLLADGTLTAEVRQVVLGWHEAERAADSMTREALRSAP